MGIRGPKSAQDLMTLTVASGSVRHGFRGSHGPPEPNVNEQWLIRRYRRPQPRPALGQKSYS
jgi:hypothetical protein